MALTLPYPSMNFVPLDILTAAEQNQLVANIEYIANQFPITSSNIDWTTSSATPTYNAGFGTAGTSFTLKKWGKIVFACGEIYHQDTSFGVFIGTIPEGFRPMYNAPVACIGQGGSRPLTLNFVLDGRIYLPVTQTGTGILAGSAIQVNGCWLVN